MFISYPWLISSYQWFVMGWWWSIHRFLGPSPCWACNHIRLRQSSGGSGLENFSDFSILYIYSVYPTYFSKWVYTIFSIYFSICWVYTIFSIYFSIFFRGSRSFSRKWTEPMQRFEALVTADLEDHSTHPILGVLNISYSSDSSCSSFGYIRIRCIYCLHLQFGSSHNLSINFILQVYLTSSDPLKEHGNPNSAGWWLVEKSRCWCVNSFVGVWIIIISWFNADAHFPVKMILQSFEPSYICQVIYYSYFESHFSKSYDLSIETIYFKSKSKSKV